jgi:hypothetical protein
VPYKETGGRGIDLSRLTPMERMLFFAGKLRSAFPTEVQPVIDQAYLSADLLAARPLGGLFQPGIVSFERAVAQNEGGIYDSLAESLKQAASVLAAGIEVLPNITTLLGTDESGIVKKGGLFQIDAGKLLIEGYDTLGPDTVSACIGECTQHFANLLAAAAPRAAAKTLPQKGADEAVDTTEIAEPGQITVNDGDVYIDVDDPAASGASFVGYRLLEKAGILDLIEKSLGIHVTRLDRLKEIYEAELTRATATYETEAAQQARLIVDTVVALYDQVRQALMSHMKNIFGPNAQLQAAATKLIEEQAKARALARAMIGEIVSGEGSAPETFAPLRFTDN